MLVSFPRGSDYKESAYNPGDPGLIPGLEGSSREGNGNPLRYSCLENSMDRGAWRATVHGAAESQTWLKWPAFLVLKCCARWSLRIFWALFYDSNILITSMAFLSLQMICKFPGVSLAGAVRFTSCNITSPWWGFVSVSGKTFPSFSLLFSPSLPSLCLSGGLCGLINSDQSSTFETLSVVKSSYEIIAHWELEPLAALLA